MAQELEQYARYFHEGGRIKVSVPLAQGGSFPEWGMVVSLDEDLLQVDLSRDALPVQARLELGRTLDLGLPSKQGGMSCRGVLVDDHVREHRLVLRLIEDVFPFEPREYYRQDVYLPLYYRLPLSQNESDVRASWEERRREIEFAAQSPEPGEPEELEDSREEIRARLERRKATPPVAANISGGGLRFNISQKLVTGMLIELGIYLPDLPRLICIVGEVVEVLPLPDGNRYSTALKYRFIDEADRDRLIGYVTAQQLMQLSQQSPRVEAEGPARVSPWRIRLVATVAFGFIAAAGWLLARSVMIAQERGVKWEVQRVFDEGIMDLLRRRR